MIMNFEELNAVLAILALLVSLNVPSYLLAIMLWVYIAITKN